MDFQFRKHVSTNLVEIFICDTFVIACAHGFDGNVHGLAAGTIVSMDEQYELTPADIRAEIEALHSKLVGVDIKLACCYPQTVRAYRYAELQSANIEIIGNWNKETLAEARGNLLTVSPV